MLPIEAATWVSLIAFVLTWALGTVISRRVWKVALASLVGGIAAFWLMMLAQTVLFTHT